MKNLTLTIRNIGRLNKLQKRLAENKPIAQIDKTYLSEFLSQIPPASSLLLGKKPLDLILDIPAWDRHDDMLRLWLELLENLPGWNYCPFAFLVDNDNLDLLHQNVLIVAWFAPSYSYNCIRSSESRAYEVWLKDNGAAVFQLPTLEDAEKFPELYNFKGTWKEAYLLLIETLKKGWPMEEFPEELKPFLKK